MQVMQVGTWAAFKTLCTAKKLLMQYAETADSYDVMAPEAGVFIWQTGLLKGTEDSTDFETNFKATANAPLEIKAAVGRPVRVTASPQPSGTTEHWKGYVINCSDTDTSAYIDITFASVIYLRGGSVCSADVTSGDKFKVEIQVAANGYTVITPMEDCYLLPNKTVEVISPECMEFPTSLRVRITFTPAAVGTAKKVYVLLDFYA